MSDKPLTDDLQLLVEQAAAARQNAYAPHSGYLVGAAVRLSDGRVFTGVNVENASYGLTLCAERTAVASAVAAGAKPGDFDAIAVATRDGGTPCGACRQFMFEFGDFPVVVAATDKQAPPQQHTVAGLLPDGFRLEQ
ncbi:Cytidine deaminase [Posidoniimonas corsicana]|uniref:Cytidine deaminase n=1 Tax=Posidoniimonas corsicana TaxID=1938618 RepID=A0A5C5VBD1_9BACT|nr:cytidine deaminase [Posidoniimonas corsicana]TWT35139.1 Cytidine deaminase [Posidoniimonas corsicana]